MTGEIDSAAWTGRFWHIADNDDADDLESGVPASIWRQIAADEAVEYRRQSLKAFAALWGPSIPNPPANRREGWTIYDGFERDREEDWTFWRAIRASIAIATGRRWKKGDGETYNLAFWDSHSTYGGYEVMRLQLMPGCRAEIFSDGETFM